MAKTTIDKLSDLSGFGTSMITLTISSSTSALNNAKTLLSNELNTATNIKSRV